MAYQLSDIRNKVRTRVRDTSYSGSEINDFINDTQNDVFNEYRLPFMQSSQSYTVDIGNSDITGGDGLPATFFQTISLISTSSGHEQVVPYMEYNELDQSFPDLDDASANPASTSPEYWYYYGETIRVFPAPASAYTVTLRYYRKPVTLVDDTDIPDIPSQYEELLVVGAAYRIQQVKDNYDQAAIFQNKYDEILQKLVVRSSQPQVGRPHVMGINRGRMRTRRIDSYRRI